MVSCIPTVPLRFVFGLEKGRILLIAAIRWLCRTEKLVYFSEQKRIYHLIAVEDLQLFSFWSNLERAKLLIEQARIWNIIIKWHMTLLNPALQAWFNWLHYGWLFACFQLKGSPFLAYRFIPLITFPSISSLSSLLVACLLLSDCKLVLSSLLLICWPYLC